MLLSSHSNMEDSEIHEIYARVKPALLSDCIPSDKPLALLTGGAPGSGKGALAEILKAENPISFLKIDGDEFRSYHPLAVTLKAGDPIKYTTETQSICWIFKQSLIQDCIHNRYSIILEGTLGSPPGVLSTIEQLKEGGYIVEIHAVASHPRLTQLSLTRRYAEEVLVHNAGRLATNNAELAKGMSSTLDAIYLANAADKIHLYVQKPPEPHSGDVFRLEKATEYIHSENGWNVRNLPSFAVENLRGGQIKDLDLIQSYVQSTRSTLEELADKGTEACLKASSMLNNELKPIENLLESLSSKSPSIDLEK